jgi:hypothetical protein
VADDAPTTVYVSDELYESDESDELAGRKRSAPVTAKGTAPAPTGPEPAPPPKPAQSIHAISMKTPANVEVQGLGNPPTPMLQRPNLRGDLTPVPQPRQNLGNLAPPYDPKAARARSMREYVIWGCLAVILASAVALIMWFAAR